MGLYLVNPRGRIAPAMAAVFVFLPGLSTADVFAAQDDDETLPALEPAREIIVEDSRIVDFRVHGDRALVLFNLIRFGDAGVSSGARLTSVLDLTDGSRMDLQRIGADGVSVYLSREGMADYLGLESVEEAFLVVGDGAVFEADLEAPALHVLFEAPEGMLIRQAVWWRQETEQWLLMNVRSRPQPDVIFWTVASYDPRTAQLSVLERDDVGRQIEQSEWITGANYAVADGQPIVGLHDRGGMMHRYHWTPETETLVRIGKAVFPVQAADRQSWISSKIRGQRYSLDDSNRRSQWKPLEANSEDPLLFDLAAGQAIRRLVLPAEWAATEPPSWLNRDVSILVDSERKVLRMLTRRTGDGLKTGIFVYDIEGLAGK